ncbi:MAG: hypothetical protein KGO02_20315 [Alphaproteobacteria bacterium]|nr:hypothetical protein [Gammaproteobacteria bacterium]MDE2466036.1 hypothetical protein [Alphaproteobacteria bacterium]
MTDDEFNKACNFLLEGLRDLRPVLAKELTKKLDGPQYKGFSKKDRKIEKVRLLHAKDPSVISQIFAKENAVWGREPKSDTSNFFYMLERRAKSLNPYGEQTGGNYTTKA